MSDHVTPLCVLGMHRSGTSCLTGSLEQAGLFLGEVKRASPNNPKGNRENTALQKLNEAVLVHSGGSWDVVPERIDWTAEHSQARDALIGDFAAHGLPWGFKDPRCLITLPFWRDALPDMRFAATLRHPVPVARSLMRRAKLRPATPPIALWLAYNRRLLDLCRTHDIPLVCFDWPDATYLEGVAMLATRLGLPHVAPDDPFFDADLVHATDGAEAAALDTSGVLPEALEVHAALHALAVPVTGPTEAVAPAKVATPAPAPAKVATPAPSQAPSQALSPAPKLSIVVNFHKMKREAARTLHALSPAYQQGVAAEDYEVIAVENGSAELDPDWVEGFGPNIRYLRHETTAPSPVAGINRAAGAARGTYIATIVDGARIPTPGIVATTLRALAAHRPCFVASLAFHLGPKTQWKAVQEGYDTATEDAALDSIDWPADGYRLFEIATLAPTSKRGFLNGVPGECSWIAMPRKRSERRGGYDPGVVSPGGGLMNQDLLRRVLAMPGMTPVMLLGEATFHQVHGGAATGTVREGRAEMVASYKAEYEALRGHPCHKVRVYDCSYMGTMPPQALPFIRAVVEDDADVRQP